MRPASPDQAVPPSAGGTVFFCARRARGRDTIAGLAGHVKNVPHIRPLRSLVMLAVDCPSCGATLQMPENLAGKKVRCATCQKVISAPAGNAEADGITADPARAKSSAPDAVTARENVRGARDREATEDDDRADGPRRGPRRDGSGNAVKAGMGAGAIVAIVGVLVVGCLVCGGGVGLPLFPCRAESSRGCRSHADHEQHEDDRPGAPQSCCDVRQQIP